MADVDPQRGDVGWIPVYGGGAVALFVEKSPTPWTRHAGGGRHRRDIGRHCGAHRRSPMQSRARPVEVKPNPARNLDEPQVAESVEVALERTQRRAASPSATVTRLTSSSSSNGIGAGPPPPIALTKA